MKVRRAERLIDMTRYFLEHPQTLVSLSVFASKYEAAKSSVSEDLTILNRALQNRGVGKLTTYPGAAGGVMFTTYMSKQNAQKLIDKLCEEAVKGDRVMPGGYVYFSDILGRPEILREIGKLIATEYSNKKVDAVLTVAVKGISLAQAVAEQLNVPFVIARQDGAVTDGATVSVNYLSKSSSEIGKIQVASRALPAGSHVLLVDDFIKGGGTMSGLVDLVHEIYCEVAGITVFGEGRYTGVRKIKEFTSLLHVETVTNDDDQLDLKITPGNILDKIY
ncbi:MAG: pur operon repressor [Firmicutes bacterium]|uniref:Pur operon repressor n=1 Tax=Candidatus Gallilactobacillus intestinavium TaxID=2840838 RepID=A0A9D9E5V4_9LACO|nr:pur operon repressor [Candidatus Gallilactobacillus intestinavium]